MAGDIVFERRSAWTSATWLFELVLTLMVEHTSHDELHEELLIIRDNNLGNLAVFKLPKDQQMVVLDFLADELVAAIQPVFEPNPAIHPRTIELIDELRASAVQAREGLLGADRNDAPTSADG